jgi:hypothetical protein
MVSIVQSVEQITEEVEYKHTKQLEFPPQIGQFLFRIHDVWRVRSQNDETKLKVVEKEKNGRRKKRNKAWSGKRRLIANK